MNKKLFFLLLMIGVFALALFAVQSCSMIGLEEEEEDLTGDVSEVNLMGSLSDLEGTWAASCNYSSNEEAYITSTITFSGTTLTIQRRQYNDSLCSEPNRLEEWVSDNMRTGTIVYIWTGTQQSWGYPLVSTVKTHTFTLENSGVVSGFNSNSICGINNWQLNLATSVLGRDCWSRPKLEQGDSYFDAYKISGNSIFLRSQNNTYVKQ